VRIPQEHIMGYVRDYLSRYDTYGTAAFDQDAIHGEDEWGCRLGGEPAPNLPALGALGILAEEAGIPVDSIRNWLCGRRKTVSWETVESLLMAMDRPDLWHVSPLDEFYETATP
jgi:hypothetical protein